MRIVAYNMLYTLSEAKWRSDIREIKERADVIGFQESKRAENFLPEVFNGDWGLFIQKRRDGEDEGREEVAIAWRKSVVDASDFSNERILKVPPNNFPDRYIASCVLTAGKFKYRFGTTHFPSQGANGLRHRTYYRPMMENFNEWVGRHDDFPMIIAADWNWPVRRSRPPAALDRWRFRGSGVMGIAVDQKVPMRSFHVIQDQSLHSDHAAVQVIVASDPTSEKDEHPDEPRQFEPINIVTQNIHWPNNEAEQKEDIDKIDQRADFVMFQEAYSVPVEKFLGDKAWGVYQQHGGNGKGDNVLAWRHSEIEVKDRGTLFLENQDGKGHPDKDYLMPWVKAKVNGYTMLFGSVHPPHLARRKADPGIYATIADKIEEWWLKQNHPIVIGGDWNKKTKEDPNNLAERVRGKWIHSPVIGIDGFLVSKGLKFGSTVTINDGVNSHHPIVMARLVDVPGKAQTPPDDEVDPEEKEKEPKSLPVENQKFQEDTGHNPDIDHTDCCGDREIP